MTASVDVLRDQLASREATLTSLRSRVKSAKEAAAKPRPQSTISDIQRRYLSAVAQLEEKDKEQPKPVIRSSSDAVSSLASKWNQGMEGVKVQKTAVQVRGDVSNAKKNFAERDVPKLSSASSRLSDSQKKNVDHGPAEFLVEDGSEVPSWAKNQQKLLIKKENARNSVRDVDVKDLQGSVLEQASRDGSEVERTQVQAGGNVKAALAMWGKTAEEDAKVLARQKEEEERQARAKEKLRQEEEAQRKAEAVASATTKFASMQLSDLTTEPKDEIELIVFLERKIVLIEKEINDAESELENLEDSQ